MNKICTSLKQSKKLIELGIDIGTSDMHYMYRHWEIDENTIGAQSDAHAGFNLDFYCGVDNGKTYHYIPAWSLTALLNIFPYYEINNNGVNIQLSVNGEALITKKGECLLDLVVNMIIHLHEFKML